MDYPQGLYALRILEKNGTWRNLNGASACSASHLTA
jgi:hypothetical protein